MMLEKDCQIEDTADPLLGQFGDMIKLFDGLKQSAHFIYDVGLECGLSNDRCDQLKTKIDALFLKMNESIHQTSNKIVETVSQNVETSKMLKLQDEKDQLYSKYNEALNQNVALDARITALTNDFNTLRAQDAVLMAQNADLMAQNAILRQEKQDLEQRINDAHVKSAENLEEDNPTLEVHLSGSSMRRSTADESIEVPATADRFIEIFEGMFKDADDIVQIIKHVSKTETRARPEYEAKALEKARTMRQLIHSMLQIFRKARINPSILSSDVGSQVADELERIYGTLSKVKKDLESNKKE